MTDPFGDFLDKFGTAFLFAVVLFMMMAAVGGDNMRKLKSVLARPRRQNAARRKQ